MKTPAKPTQALNILFGINAAVLAVLIGALAWQTRQPIQSAIAADPKANALDFKEQLHRTPEYTGRPSSFTQPSTEYAQHYVFGKNNQIVSISQTAHNASNSAPSGQELVSINSASAAQLADGLIGIGPRKAEAIVDYRTQHGAFTRLDQLGEVDGIGAKTLEKNRHLINLN